MDYLRNYVVYLHKEYGWGILFSREDDEKTYFGLFQDNEIHKVDYTNREEGSYFFDSFTKNRSYFSTLNQLLKDNAKAEELYKKSPATIVKEKPKNVYGARYAVGKEFVDFDLFTTSGRNIDISCTCNKKNCVHQKVAALTIYKEVKAMLHQYLISDKDVPKNLYIEPDLEYKLFHAPDVSIDSIMQDILEPNSDDYIKYVFRRIILSSPDWYDSEYLSEYYVLFVKAFINERMNNILTDQSFIENLQNQVYERQSRSNVSYYKKKIKIFEKSYKEIYEKNNFVDKDEESMKWYILKTKEDWLKYLDYYAVNDIDHDEVDYEVLEEATKCYVDTPDNREKVMLVMSSLDVNAESKTTPDVYFHLGALLPVEKRAAAFFSIQNYQIPVSELENLNRDDQKLLVSKVVGSSESISYIMEDLLKDESDEEKGKYLISLGQWKKHKNFSKEEKEKILEYARNLENGKLVTAYLESSFNNKISANTARLEGDLEKEIVPFFIRDFHFDGKGQKIICTYEIKINGKTFLSMDEKEGSLISYGINSLWEDIDKEEFKRIVLEGNEKRYKEEKEKEEERIEKLLFAEKNKEFNKSYAQLLNSFSSDPGIVFSEENKVSVEYSFYYEGNSSAVAFKVGNTKSYIVKNAMDFITSFRSGTTLEYGKGLVLTHTEENLQPDDANIIRMLLSARLSSGRKSDSKNKKFVTINNGLFSNILEALKGRVITYNDIEAKVRLEKVHHTASVNSKCKLRTSIEKEETIIPLGQRSYRLIKEGNNYFVDQLDNTQDEVKLLLFFNSHNNVDVSPIAGDFRKNILSRFSNFIEVSDDSKNKFHLSALRINSYFDYEKGYIKCKIEVEKEGEKITDLDSLDRLDKEKIDGFYAYLKTLGFSDNMEIQDDSKVLSFFKMDFSRLRAMSTVYLSESLTNKQILSVSRQIVRITYDSGIMNIFLEKSDFSEKELSEILSAIRQKKKYIILKGDRIIDLENQEAKDFNATVSDFNMDKDNLYQKKEISMVTAVKAFAHERNCHVDKYLRNMIEDIKGFKTADIPLPKLNAKLRGYQIEGFNWLSILSEYNMGGILADDMGLGKTLQIIALLKADKEKKPSLIACPKSLVFNWKTELARFDGKMKVVEIYGPEATRSKLISSIKENEKAIYITSYDSLRLDADKYTMSFNYFVLDEAQYIKNIHAQKTKSVKNIKALHRFALTGTPIENSIIDLWSIFDFLMPGYLEDLTAFKSSETESIRRKVSPFILRRIKEDVLSDLPPKYERILSSEMGAEQRKIYEAVRAEAAKVLKEGGKAFDILPYLMRLRQISIDPKLYIENYKGGSSKLDMLSSLIPDYISKGHRILIFSQFVKALDEVDILLDKLSIPHFMLTGDTDVKKRMDMMLRFNEEDGPDVFLISLKAGGTGLNLTGADTVIHLDPWWNVAAENQASDRTHRIGQRRNVEVIKLISENSIEERVLELQEIKKELVKNVISDSDESVVEASLEDLAFILG